MSGTGPPPKGRSELATRFVLGPAMLAVVALVYWADTTWMAARGHGGWLTAAVLGVLGLAGVHEYVVMMRGADRPVARRLLLVFAFLLLASPFVLAQPALHRELTVLVFATLGLLFAVALASLTKAGMERGLELQGATLLGFLWIAWSTSLAQGMAMQHLPSVLFVVLVCKGGDSGAYLLGISFGRHKLIPHISGGKTIEGTVGGLVTSVVLAVLLGGLLLPEGSLGLTGAVLVGIMLNVTTQTGDLIESLLKRRCGVKDSSALLPAHGGVLDLIDSLLFSFPAFHLVQISL